MLHETEQSELPELDDLVTFLRVAELGTITAAATRLGVPKSTVSRRLTRLEEKLGVSLVARTTRKLSLTDEGSAYRERAGAALASLVEATAAVREQSEVPRGHLRVTAPVDLGEAALATVVAKMACSYPEVTVEVLLTDRPLDLVAEAIDVAVRAAPSLPDSSLIARRVASTDMHLFASPTYLERYGVPKQPKELASHELLLLHAQQGRGVLRLAGADDREFELDVRARVGANDFGFLRRCAIEGAGIAPLPSVVTSEATLAGTLVRVLPEYRAGRGVLFVAHPAGRLLSAKVRAFREMLISHLEAAALGGWTSEATKMKPEGGKSAAKKKRAR